MNCLSNLDDFHAKTAVPYFIGKALPLSHDGLLSRELACSRAGDRRTFHPGTAEPFRVSPP
jgi:hypothetical protein